MSADLSVGSRAQQPVLPIRRLADLDLAGQGDAANPEGDLLDDPLSSWPHRAERRDHCEMQCGAWVEDSGCT